MFSACFFAWQQIISSKFNFCQQFSSFQYHFYSWYHQLFMNSFTLSMHHFYKTKTFFSECLNLKGKDFFRGLTSKVLAQQFHSIHLIYLSTRRKTFLFHGDTLWIFLWNQVWCNNYITLVDYHPCKHIY